MLLLTAVGATAVAVVAAISGGSNEPVRQPSPPPSGPSCTGQESIPKLVETGATPGSQATACE